MNDYLIHYGVKGMKWGVRNDKYKSADKSTRKKYREAYKQSDEYKDKKASRKQKIKTAGKIALGVGIGALAAVGGYTLADSASYAMTGRSIIDNLTPLTPSYHAEVARQTRAKEALTNQSHEVDRMNLATQWDRTTSNRIKETTQLRDNADAASKNVLEVLNGTAGRYREQKLNFDEDLKKLEYLRKNNPYKKG